MDGPSPSPLVGYKVLDDLKKLQNCIIDANILDKLKHRLDKHMRAEEWIMKMKELPCVCQRA